MKITVIYPSRSRADICKKTLKEWKIFARKSELIEWIISIDQDDLQLKNYVDFYEPGNFILEINRNKSAIEAINRAALIATGNLFVVISDDFSAFDNWDVLLLQALEGKSDFCVKTDDGLQPTLITMPIMDRMYYERYGYVYHPDYKHMFADQELTSVALMTGKYIKLDLKFSHLHYSTGKTHKDEINVKNDLTWKQGENLFNERLKTNFGITEPIMAYTDIQWR